MLSYYPPPNPTAASSSSSSSALYTTIFPTFWGKEKLKNICSYIKTEKMALSSFSIKFGSISCPYDGHRTGTSPRLLKLNHVLSVRVSANSTPKARFVARRTESVSVPQLQRPLSSVRMMFRILSMQYHCFDFSIFDEFF